MLKRISLSLLCASFLLLVVAQKANAALKLKIQGPVTTLIVLDNSPQDSTPTVGAISFSGTIDNVPLVVATGISKPHVGDASLAELDFNAVSQSSAVGGTLTMSVTDTDYPAGAGPTTVTTQVGGTTHGSTSLQGFLDTANAEFGIAGSSVCTSGPMGPYTGAFTGEVTVPCVLTGAPASMTFVAVATLGPGQLQSFGGKILVPVPALPIGCRFTGGGVDTNYNWDHTLESGRTIRNGAGNLPDPIDRYQFGGQVGARTAQQPLPSGEWEHHQQTGPAGSFSFHGGSHSADKGTWIADVRCSDAGYCRQARPAPCKQLDFDGVGTFSNVGKGANAPTFLIPNPNVITEPNGNSGKTFTYHWFEVNIDDLGEPGNFNSGAPNSTICPGRGFGEKSAGLFFPDPVGNPGAAVLLPAAPLGNCDCPDFYRITVYKGVLSTEVTFLPNGKVDPASLNKVDVIYEVYGYGDGGNLQIHPPTGFDSK
jgi:hypothetical protein